MKVKKNLLYLFAATITLFSACSTDLDVNGEWKETMVVYGLLDQAQPKQYIKINKAFLGEGNALEYAQIKDSVQYVNSLVVKLKRVSDGTEYTLSPDATKPKDAGTFFSTDQANAIYSAAVPIVTTSQYQLIIRNSETGEEVTSQTPIVNDFTYSKPPASSTSFYFIVPSSDNYRFYVEWSSAKNARLYQMVVRFNYIDSTVTGNDTTYLDWIFPVKKTNGLSGGELLSYDFRGHDYLQYIGNKLCNSCTQPTDLIARRALKTELLMYSAADDLSTFIDVNKPSTGIIQTKPEFTNINNGLGIFSARYSKAPYSRVLEKNTLDSLACGRYTKRLKFLNFANALPACP
jgi:hypothetical protein